MLEWKKKARVIRVSFFCEERIAKELDDPAGEPKGISIVSSRVDPRPIDCPLHRLVTTLYRDKEHTSVSLRPLLGCVQNVAKNLFTNMIFNSMHFIAAGERMK
ncbi:MAG TPA: hypothetical protein VF471_13625 [Pseudoxanthomonas sp.]